MKKILKMALLCAVLTCSAFSMHFTLKKECFYGCPSFLDADRFIESIKPGDVKGWTSTVRDKNQKGKENAFFMLAQLNDSLVAFAVHKESLNISNDKRKRLQHIYDDLCDYNFTLIKPEYLQQKAPQNDNAKARKAIFEENQKLCKKEFAFATQQSIGAIRVYNDPVSSRMYKETEFNVVNGDCIDYALYLKNKENLTPLVLDMAHPEAPGGGAHDGSGAAQEEQIVYRSNLYDLLDSQKTNKNYSKYFIPHRGGILIPSVAIFREGVDKNYALKQTNDGFIKADFVDIFAAAAYRHENRRSARIEKDLFNELRDPNVYWGNMQAKIESMMIAGIRNGNDALVFGAFGTGAFQNPSNEVINIFKNAITKYGKYYKRIDFAILDPQEGPTYQAFKDTFNNITIPNNTFME